MGGEGGTRRGSWLGRCERVGGRSGSLVSLRTGVWVMGRDMGVAAEGPVSLDTC